LLEDLRWARTEILARLAQLSDDDLRRRRQLENLIKGIDRIIDGGTEVTEEGVKVKIRGLVERLRGHIKVVEAYHAGLESAKKELGIDFLPDEKAIEAVTNYAFDLIRDIGEDVRLKVKSAIRMGIIEGEGIEKIVKRLEGTALTPGPWRTLRNRCRVIARTEVARAFHTARRQAYTEAQVEYVKVIGPPTSCPVCTEYLGKIFRLDEAPHFPLHPNCLHDISPVRREGRWLITERDRREWEKWMGRYPGASGLFNKMKRLNRGDVIMLAKNFGFTMRHGREIENPRIFGGKGKIAKIENHYYIVLMNERGTLVTAWRTRRLTGTLRRLYEAQS